MKQKSIFILLISILLSACPLPESESQDKSREDSSKTENTAKLRSENANLKAKLSIIADYTYSQNPDFNIDSLCEVVGKELTKTLLKKELSAAEIEDLGLELSAETHDNHQIRIYAFGYDCGGTRGFVTHSILQWKNDKGQLFAYDFTKIMECNFGEIYKLINPQKDMYLMLGQEKASGICELGVVYGIEIRDKYLIANTPLFVNRPYLNFCNIDFQFDEESQILTGELMPEASKEDIISLIQEQGEYSKSEKDNKALLEMLKDYNLVANSRFKLKFKGEKFEKWK
jgi:hypothetical protein